MRSKHPEARGSEQARCALLRPVSAAAAPTVLPEEVVKGIRGFPEGSAGGKSGLKPQHLKDALVPGHGDELARVLAEVVNLLACGKAHPSARQWICCASLTALAKPDGGLRSSPKMRGGFQGVFRAHPSLRWVQGRSRGGCPRSQTVPRPPQRLWG